ncbi:MAG: hypothetical protein JXA69_15700 [Phycisphaerae bacterium]|nr:hypothetical protein [Phycisphaerae bacterium]
MIRKMMIAGLVCGLTGITAWAAETAPPETVEFKMVFQPGRTLTYRMTSKGVGSMKMFDPMPEQKFAQAFEMEIVTTCREVKADGSAVVELRLSRIAMKQAIGGVETVFDSATFDPAAADDPLKDLLGRLFSSITDARLVLTIGADGQPIAISGVTEAFDKVLDGLGSGLSSVVFRQVLKPMRQVFDDKAMLEQAKQWHRMMPPPGPKHIGDTWERTWQMPVPLLSGEMKGSSEYEFVAIEEIDGRRCAKIRTKDSIETAPLTTHADDASRPKTIFDRMKWNMSMSGGDGVLYIDYGRGELVKMRSAQRMSMEMSMAPDENAEEAELKSGIPSMTYNLTQAVSFELVEAESATTTRDGDGASAKAPGPAAP